MAADERASPAVRRATLAAALLLSPLAALGYATPRGGLNALAVECAAGPVDPRSVNWDDKRCAMVGADSIDPVHDEVDEGMTKRVCLCLHCEAGGSSCPDASVCTLSGTARKCCAAGETLTASTTGSLTCTVAY